MKHSLQLKLGQSLTMTPQLQQAIRLLQLSSLDLQAEIQEALESNLMLEAEDGFSLSDASPANDEPSASEQVSTELNAGDQDIVATDTIPDELPVDTDWTDVYDGMPTSSKSSDVSAIEMRDRVSSAATSLQDHLCWQLDMSPFSPTDHAIASALIDGIDDDGYLHVNLQDLAADVNQTDNDTEVAEVEAVLHRIQRFDPLGVGCRDLSECLRLQLLQLKDTTPGLKTALKLVDGQLELLASRDFATLTKRLRVKKNELKAAMELVQSLNPKPGALISQGHAEYVTPDVVVSRTNGSWLVSLNSDGAPKLRINASYEGLIQRGSGGGADNDLMKSHLQEARWLIKSLQSRNDTLLRVAACLVEHQRAYFDYGDEAMKPLVLRDVAEQLDLHESTVSRVTANKYMHTPRGIVPFKYFFSSHVSTADGGECSATAIQAMLKKLIEQENPAKPLSDAKLAEHLAERGINVARRTIAKYREAIGIPPSNERKCLT